MVTVNQSWVTSCEAELEKRTTLCGTGPSAHAMAVNSSKLAASVQDRIKGVTGKGERDMADPRRQVDGETTMSI
jgi:hypothetical protein